MGKQLAKALIALGLIGIIVCSVALKDLHATISICRGAMSISASEKDYRRYERLQTQRTLLIGGCVLSVVLSAVSGFVLATGSQNTSHERNQDPNATADGASDENVTAAYVVETTAKDLSGAKAQLEQLNELHENQLITDEEYAAKRKQILGL